MYRSIVRPILFLFPPEFVHGLVANFVRFAFIIPGIKSLVGRFFTYNNPRLERTLFGLRFPNPVGIAAGFDKNATLYDSFKSFGFGFIEIGTVTPQPQSGNPKPRSFRLVRDRALINRMGFNNHGLACMAKRLAARKKDGLIVGGNIGKNTATPNNIATGDYLECFKGLYDFVDYFVVNISCPNIANLKDLQDRDALKEILMALVSQRSKQSIWRPILLKISPDLNRQQLDDTLEIIATVGIDGIVATNTTTSRENLMADKDEIGRIGNGGLSGAPLTKRSTEIIRYISEKTQGKLPIIASGGVMSAADALEKIKAGASLVQVFTGFIYEGPGIAKAICKSLISHE